MVSEGRRRLHVTLPHDVVEAIDQLVGKGRRSQFIAETVSEELRRRRLQAVLDDIAESQPSGEGYAWDDWESSAAWVRAQRRGEPPFRIAIAIDDCTPCGNPERILMCIGMGTPRRPAVTR